MYRKETKRKTKLPTGTYTSVVKEIEFDPEYVNEEAFYIRYQLVNENGTEYEHTETFFNTSENERTDELFSYWENNGIPYKNIKAFKGCREKLMQILDASESATLDKLECDCLERICYNHQNADENTCNEMINNINCFEALEKNKEIFIGKINARITQIWSKEDDEVFDNLYLNTNIRDPEAVKKSIDFIKQKGRTSSSKKYISALTACTTKNIKKAKKFQKSTTKSLLYIGWGGFILAIILAIIGMGFAPILGGISVIPLVYYSDLKKTWNTLTLDGAIVHKMFSLTGKEERRRKDN